MPVTRPQSQDFAPKRVFATILRRLQKLFGRPAPAPSYFKTIVCLANSRRNAGRCLAGKEVLGSAFTHTWIRPVSERLSQEISEEERRYKDGTDPEVLDIMSIPLLEAGSRGHQTENHVIDSGFYWRKEGGLLWQDLAAAVDQVSGDLWVNGFSSHHGTNDRIPEKIASKLTNSLLLVRPQALAIKVAVEGSDSGGPKRKIRASFALNGRKYLLAVTDPIVETDYLSKPDGYYPIADAYLCVSAGEGFMGYCYKLVAAIVRPEHLSTMAD